MINIMYEISNNWGVFVFAIVTPIIALITEIFITEKRVKIKLLSVLLVISLVLIISKIGTYSIVKVPNIVGYTVADAKKILKENELKFPDDFLDVNEQEIIAEQTPQKNSFTKKNSSISIKTRKDREKEWYSRINIIEFEILSEIKTNINGEPITGYFTDRQYSDSSVYSGYYKDGVPNGYGIFIRKIDKYEGDFVNGLPDGKGKFTITAEGDDDSEVGDLYDGSWSKGYFNGYGIIFYTRGNGYKGYFLNGGRHGKGTFTWEDGGSYDGDWENNKMHGKGIRIWADSSKYEGNWNNDNRHGKGICTYASGNIYEGDWENDNPHGKGTFTWKDGSKYEGDWINGYQQGNGILTWEDGSKYEGDFLYGNRHGKGKLTYGKDNEFAGDVIEGEYVEDSRSGQGTYYYKNGNYDIGTWKNHKKHGTFLCYNSKGQLLREERYVNDKLQK